MTAESPILPSSLREAWEAKCFEYYSACDPLNKGFITKEDFCALKTVLLISDEQISQIFDIIDTGGSGKLTYEEFQLRTFDGILEILQNETSLQHDTKEQHLETGDNEAYMDFLRVVDAEELLKDEPSVREMWLSLYRGANDDLLKKFEQSIRTIVKERDNGLKDFEAMRKDLHRKASLLEEQGRLFEENAREIQSEAEHQLKKCRERGDSVRKKMEEELIAKDEKLTQLMKNQSELESQLRRLQHTDETKDKENTYLLQEREELRRSLEDSELGISGLNAEIADLKRNIERHKHELYQKNTDVSEGITMIFEKLNEISKQLAVERSVQPAYRKFKRILRQRKPDLVPMEEHFSGDFDSMDSSPSVEPETREGSRLGNYLQVPTSLISNTDSSLSTTDFEVDDDYFDQKRNSLNLNIHSGQQISEEDQREFTASLPDQGPPELIGTRRKSVPVFNSPGSEEQASCKLEDVTYYLVVTLGDTGVGKTAFIKKFCTGTFHPHTETTIVPDMYNRTFEVNGKTFGLELFGIFGGERFESIAKGTLKHADGAVVLYDITERETFKNLEKWISLLKKYRDSAGLMIVGTKLDLVEKQPDSRQVSYEEGAELAKKHDALFFELSLETGFNIEDSMIQFTASLIPDTDSSQSMLDHEVVGNSLSQNHGSSNFNDHSGRQDTDEDHHQLPKSISGQSLPVSKQTRYKPDSVPVFRTPRKLQQKSLKMESTKYYRVVTLGDSGVGKTVFINRFCNHVFNLHARETIVPDMEIRTFEMNGKTFGLELWGTAGQERFNSVTSSVLIKADGAIIMYDITQRKTFKNTEKWISLLRKYKDNSVLMIVGTKMDLAEASSVSRQVSHREGAELAQKLDALFFETSSKTGFNIEDSMRQLTARLHETMGEEIFRAIRLASESETASPETKQPSQCPC